MVASTTTIVGFPKRATRDSELSVEDLRVLICICTLAQASGWCAEDLHQIAREVDLPVSVIPECLATLSDRDYVHRRRQGRTTTLALAAHDPEAAEPGTPPARPIAAPNARGGTGRAAQARLHSGMLRRRAGRPVGSIEFDDSPRSHPAVGSLREPLADDPAGIDGFRFWLKTILDPKDVEIFSGWANRRSADYRALIRKFDNAEDDQAFEALLEDTLALLDREKSAGH